MSVCLFTRNISSLLWDRYSFLTLINVKYDYSITYSIKNTLSVTSVSSALASVLWKSIVFLQHPYSAATLSNMAELCLLD